MEKLIQSIRGMSDILPEQTVARQKLELTLSNIVRSYGYQEIRFPIVENTALFKRAIGEVTDIVEKEMYTFDDRNGDSLSLRPEGTACCVRACLQNNLLYNQTQRLYYIGPMFRHERPQKGRYRQFSQFGLEAYGFSETDIELEMLIITDRFWKALGLSTYVRLEINTLGTLEERQAYKTILVDYLQKNISLLDEDSVRRLEKNPLRILDSKNPAMQALIKEAPQLINHLQENSKQRFDYLCESLKKHSISFRINPRLVRGLDYYSHSVFEWVTQDLGAQGTVCAGGRYDSLVSQLGGNACPAFGFAIGIDRLLLLLEEIPAFMNSLPKITDIYVIFMGKQAEQQGRLWLEQLRLETPYRIIAHCGGGSMKSQWKKADKSEAALALMIGDEEIIKQTVSIKFLREESSQTEVSQEKTADFLAAYFEKN